MFKPRPDAPSRTVSFWVASFAHFGFESFELNAVGSGYE